MRPYSLRRRFLLSTCYSRDRVAGEIALMSADPDIAKGAPRGMPPRRVRSASDCDFGMETHRRELLLPGSPFVARHLAHRLGRRPLGEQKGTTTTNGPFYRSASAPRHRPCRWARTGCDGAGVAENNR